MSCSSFCKECSKIEIERNDGKFILSCPLEDYLVIIVTRSDVHPMHRLMARRVKDFDPHRRQVHIEEQLHALYSGNSIS